VGIALPVVAWRGNFWPELKPATSNQPQAFVRCDWFAATAAAYLVLPSLVFLLTWVRPWIGLPVALVVAVTYALFLRQNCFSEIRPKLSTGNWVFILGLAFVFTLLAGIGGFVPQASDYEKHNLAFHDLMGQSWPVYYANGPETNYLCYGMAYYLPPVCLAHVIGTAWLPTATFLWGFIGVALFFYWVATFSQSPKKTLIIVLLFASTETLWHMFLHVLHNSHLGERGHFIDGSLEHLGIRSDYSDSYSAIQYRPQHVISGWLGTALFYEMFWIRRSPRGAGFIWAACFLWSPLTCLGLLLVPLVALKRWRWWDALEPVNVGGGVLLVVLAIYFQGHVPLTEKGPIWKFSTGGNWLVLYPWFLLMELTPMLLIYLADRKYNLLGDLRPLFLGSFVLLLLLPLYKIGYYGDLRLQAQTPALLFCGLAASRVFLNAGFTLRRPVFVLLVASQILGAVYPAGRWWQEALGLEGEDFSYAATGKKWGYQNLSDFKRYGYDYASQYLGRTNSIAARWLLR
jgi:hypothetical protein